MQLGDVLNMKSAVGMLAAVSLTRLNASTDSGATAGLKKQLGYIILSVCLKHCRIFADIFTLQS